MQQQNLLIALQFVTYKSISSSCPEASGELNDIDTPINSTANGVRKREFQFITPPNFPKNHQPFLNASQDKQNRHLPRLCLLPPNIAVT